MLESKGSVRGWESEHHDGTQYIAFPIQAYGAPKVLRADTAYWLQRSCSKKINNAFISWEAISSRLAVVRFKGCLYEPTGAVYDSLQNSISVVSRRDLLFVAGEWDAPTTLRTNLRAIS